MYALIHLQISSHERFSMSERAAQLVLPEWLCTKYASNHVPLHRPQIKDAIECGFLDRCSEQEVNSELREGNQRNAGGIQLRQVSELRQ
jgi:hypothetical protein